MSNNGKVVLGLFFSAVVHVSFGMDGEGNPKGQRLYPDISAQGLVLNQSSPLNMSSPPLSVFGTATSYLASGLGVIKKSIVNATCNAGGAFLMLGLPVNDPDAQRELAIIKEKYANVNSEGLDFKKRCEYLQSIVNRTAYCLRLFEVLPDLCRDEDMLYSQFVIAEHLDAMPKPLQIAFVQYQEKKRQLTTLVTDSARKRLTKDSNEIQPVESCVHPIDSVGLQSSGLKSETVDEKIFWKIGWPLKNFEELASINLMRCLAAYKIKQLLKTAQNFELLKTSEGRKSLEISEDKIVVRMIEKPDQLSRRIEQTGEFIRKIYALLVSRFDGVQLAAHCLKCHTYVMSESLQDDFRSFIQKQTEQITGIANEVLGTSKNQIDTDDTKTGQ